MTLGLWQQSWRQRYGSAKVPKPGKYLLGRRQSQWVVEAVLAASK
jgi:hypothetical protein